MGGMGEDGQAVLAVHAREIATAPARWSDALAKCTNKGEAAWYERMRFHRNSRAAKAAALAAIPRCTDGQRLLSGALTRLYVQTLLYPIDTLRARFSTMDRPLEELTLASLYEGALPALLLGDLPYSLICSLAQLHTTAALKRLAPHLPPSVASALAAVCTDSAGVVYKTPHDAMKAYRQKGLAKSTSEALQMMHSALPALQRAVPSTIARDALFRFVNGTASKRLKAFFQTLKHRANRLQACATARTGGAPASKGTAPLMEDAASADRSTSKSASLWGLCRCLREKVAGLTAQQPLFRTAAKATEEGEHCSSLSAGAAAAAAPRAAQYAEAALIGGLSSSLAGIAASPMDAARALVVRQAAADLEGSKRFSGVIGIARALHEAAVSGGFKALFASVPLRVLVGGCCGAVAAAFNMRPLFKPSRAVLTHPYGPGVYLDTLLRRAILPSSFAFVLLSPGWTVIGRTARQHTSDSSIRCDMENERSFSLISDYQAHMFAVPPVIHPMRALDEADWVGALTTDKAVIESSGNRPLLTSREAQCLAFN
ncbi:mitochondrial carrier superfamily protein [Cyclospora cayetanensis]|uniref:Mitochondrial carrier superfamily protein n=1 Tax=Cyclospora cayetanensis TaxID=88456 RepID=A0A1D3CW87_9EIME|nr:mitochondrial carrier superfamily protein [Cyclospora cayetanensis]